MNLLAIKERLLELGNKIGLQVEEETKESVTLHCQFTAKDYFDDSIYFKAVIFSSGTLHMFFTFNEIEKTYDNLFLINAFNSESPWFKAYITNINDIDYLELHYSVMGLSDDNEIINNFGYMLNALISEETLKYLNPLLENN